MSGNTTRLHPQLTYAQSETRVSEGHSEKGRGGTIRSLPLCEPVCVYCSWMISRRSSITPQILPLQKAKGGGLNIKQQERLVSLNREGKKKEKKWQKTQLPLLTDLWNSLITDKIAAIHSFYSPLKVADSLLAITSWEERPINSINLSSQLNISCDYLLCKKYSYHSIQNLTGFSGFDIN